VSVKSIMDQLRNTWLGRTKKVKLWLRQDSLVKRIRKAGPVFASINSLCNNSYHAYTLVDAEKEKSSLDTGQEMEDTKSPLKRITYHDDDDPINLLNMWLRELDSLKMVKCTFLLK
jgi:hypothetical protein